MRATNAERRLGTIHKGYQDGLAEGYLSVGVGDYRDG